jgi:hypothetical protein
VRNSHRIGPIRLPGGTSENGSGLYHLRQLASAGIDLAVASQAGQFDLKINTEAYLRGGRFDPDRMLEVFEGMVTENSNGP